MQQGRFADAAWAVDVKHGKRRFSGEQGSAEQLEFGHAPHKATAPGGCQPVSDTGGMLRSGVL
jgi:hypothetical protein